MYCYKIIFVTSVKSKTFGQFEPMTYHFETQIEIVNLVKIADGMLFYLQYHEMFVKVEIAYCGVTPTYYFPTLSFP
jgi:hypothetical protein